MRLGHLHAVLGRQHIEISLGHTHDQVLCSRIQLSLGHIHAVLPLLVGNLVGRTVQRLLGAELHVLLRAIEAAGHAGHGHRGVNVHMGAVGTRRQTHIG